MKKKANLHFRNNIVADAANCCNHNNAIIFRVLEVIYKVIVLASSISFLESFV